MQGIGRTRSIVDAEVLTQCKAFLVLINGTLCDCFWDTTGADANVPKVSVYLLIGCLCAMSFGCVFIIGRNGAPGCVSWVGALVC